MKKNKCLHILLLAVIAFSAVACDEHIKGGGPDSRPKPPPVEYMEVLSVNSVKVNLPDPVFPGDAYIAINVVFPNEYFNTFTQTGFSSVGDIRVVNYGDQKLMFGTGLGHDYESLSLRYNSFKAGDGIDDSADSHYYTVDFNCKVGTFDVRLEFPSSYLKCWCTPKFRVVIGKDSSDQWTVTLTALEE